jgi:hypothetical protein
VHSIGHVHLRVRDLGRSIEFVDDGGSLANIHDRLRESGVRFRRSTTASAWRCPSTIPTGTDSRPASTRARNGTARSDRGKNEPFDPAAVRRHLRGTGPRHYRGGRRMSDVLYSVPPTRRQ